MNRNMWVVLGGALFVLGVIVGDQERGGVNASGVAIDQGSRSIVTSSEDGRRLYVWDDRTRFGGTEATVREYFYDYDAATDDYGVFSRKRNITQLPTESPEITQLRGDLHAISEAMRALEEIGDTDTDLYRELATKARNIAKAISEATNKDSPEAPTDDANEERGE